MADVNARTRLLIGTTADWAAHNLVLGDGELVIERGSQIRMKVGNGAAPYSALPFVTAEAVIPPEYLTATEGDAAYLKLSDVSAGAAANKVPRMDAAGKLAYGVLPLPPVVSVSSGASDAGKLVALAPTGKIDPSMITVTTGGYKGVANLTVAKPGGVFLAGDYFINSTAGTADASWGLPAATPVTPGQQIIFNGAGWDLIGGTGGAFLPISGGTLTGPLLIKPVGAGTELEVRDEGSTAMILVNQANADPGALAEIQLRGNDLTTRLTQYGSTHGVRAQQTWLNAAGASSYLVLATANTKRMLIDPAGHVFVNGTEGLGIASEFYHQVAGSYLAYGDMRGYRALNTTANAAIQIAVFPGAGAGGKVDAEGGPLELWAGGKRSVHLDTAGNVGLGTAGYNLYGAGRTILGIQGSASSMIEFQTAGNVMSGYIAAANSGDMEVMATTSMSFAVNGAQRQRINSGGDVAMGGPLTFQSLLTLTRPFQGASAAPAGGPCIVLSNRDMSVASNARTFAAGLFCDTYRDVVATQHLAAGVWFEKTNLGNVTSGADIVFGAMANNSGNQLPTEIARITKDAVFSYLGNEIGWRNAPRKEISAPYNITDSDRGMILVLKPGAVVNVQQNFVTADALISFVNVSGGALTLNQGSGMNLYLGGSSVASSKTLAVNALGTIYFYSLNAAIINGGGVT